MMEYDNTEKICKYYLEKCGFYHVINDFLSFIEGVRINITQNHLELKQNYIRQYDYGHISSELSIKGMIKLCEIGDFVDAFVLLRKIRDNVLLDYFFINDFINNVPKSNDNDAKFNPNNVDEIIDYIAKYIVEKSNYDATNNEKKLIEKWFKTDNKSKEFKDTYKYSNYKNTLNESLNGNVEFLKKIMDNLDRIFNNYTHSNGLIYLNNPQLKENIVNKINVICSCIKDLEIVFLIYAFYINPLLLQSSDYLDYLDAGLNPPEECKYYIFPAALNIFKRIKNINQHYFKVLKENNRYGLFIEEIDYNK